MIILMIIKNLASFIRNPLNDYYSLFESIGQTMIKVLKKKKNLVINLGAGVSYLHIRLDSIPKYYQHSMYT